MVPAFPKLIQPMQSLDTSMSVLPIFVYSMKKEPPLFALLYHRKMIIFFQYNTFNREVGGRAAPAPSLSEVVLMSTYEELQLIVSVAVLIVAILNYTHKK